MEIPSVAILIVSWNGRAETLACLHSLARLDYPSYEVILIDNHSSDGSAQAVRSAFPAITVIETGENLGFVGGNNLGLDYALSHGFTYALLLNNDTEVAPDFLSRLVAASEADRQAAIAGPTIYYCSKPDCIWSAGGKIDWRNGETYMVGINQVDRGQFGNQPRRVDFVTGCALLIKLSVVRQIGMLDPRFFTYYEETEWCVRAAHAGYSILQVPQAHIWHKISPEAREASPQVHYYMTRNRLLFLRLTRARLAAYINLLVLVYLTRLLIWTIKPKWRYKASQKRAMIRAILDFSRGCFGAVNLPES